MNTKNFIPQTPSNEHILTLTAQIISSYVQHNEISITELPQLFSAVYQTVVRHGGGIDRAGGAERPAPAVAPKKSIFPDYIICLEDGKKLKMLKRHIKTSYKLTPEQYRERWNLPPDYPMVAPNYARQRSRLAKQIGLGTLRSRLNKKVA